MIFCSKKPSPSVSTLTGPTSPLTSIALADSETKLVAGSVDKTICVWETGGKRTMLHTLTGHDGNLISFFFFLFSTSSLPCPRFFLFSFSFHEELLMLTLLQVL